MMKELLIPIAISIAIIYYVHAKNILLGLRDNDGLFHLLCAKEIKENKGLFQYHQRFFPGKKVEYTYPPLLHIILSFFVGKIPDKYLLLWPIIMNFLVSLSVFAACLIMEYPVYNSLIVSSLFLIIPSNIRGAISITPRHLGILFFFLSFLFGSLAVQQKSIGYYCASIFSLSLLLISHRMGAQLAVICSTACIVFLIVQDLFYAVWGVLWLSGGYLLAVVLSRGHYNKVLKDHIKRLKLHFTFGPQTGNQKRLGNPLEIVRQNPFVLFLTYIIIFHMDIIKVTPNSLLWIASFGIVLTSLFWVWGSGERHIIFFAPFIPVLLLDSRFQDYPVLFICSLLLCGIFVGTYLRTMYGKDLIPQETIEAFSILNNQNESDIVLITPRISSPAFVYSADKRIFAYPHDAGAMEFNRLAVRYRIDDIDYMANLINRNKVDTILNNSEFRIHEIVTKTEFQKVFENALWEIYIKMNKKAYE